MNKTHRLFLSLAIMMMTSALHATIQLPMFFSDGMVLQQQTDCRLWGTAQPNHAVSVKASWSKTTYKTHSDASGHFEIVIPTPAASTSHTITISDGTPLTLQDILVGEVWICSGQSNMEMPMKGFKMQPVEGTTEELLRCRDQQLRLFTVKRHASLTPATDVAGTWSSANSESVREFSATAYYFGRALRQQLGVPVGLIVTAWGGSACEAWMAPDWLRAFPKVTLPANEQQVNKLKQRCPTALYYGQLHPLIGYAMRGVIWYQGEDNVPRYDYYAQLLTAMVKGWRSDWKQGDFPFYYCQIAPYDYSLIYWKGSELLREQQWRAEQMIPNARMAVLMDAGLEYGIHPRKKRQAGERLALLALSNTYGVKGLPDFATYKSTAFQGDTAVITFDRSKEWVYFEHGTTSKNFEIAGSDSIFHPATKVWISRNRVYAKSDSVAHPVAVRYAFHDWAEGDLMHDGLPVSSFRSDF